MFTYISNFVYIYYCIVQLENSIFFFYFFSSPQSGTHITKVRSLTLDQLDEEILVFLEKIGNNRANLIFEDKEIEKEGGVGEGGGEGEGEGEGEEKEGEGGGGWEGGEEEREEGEREKNESEREKNKIENNWGGGCGGSEGRA